MGRTFPSIWGTGGGTGAASKPPHGRAHCFCFPSSCHFTCMPVSLETRGRGGSRGRRRPRRRNRAVASIGRMKGRALSVLMTVQGGRTGAGARSRDVFFWASRERECMGEASAAVQGRTMAHAHCSGPLSSNAHMAASGLQG